MIDKVLTLQPLVCVALSTYHTGFITRDLYIDPYNFRLSQKTHIFEFFNVISLKDTCPQLTGNNHQHPTAVTAVCLQRVVDEFCLACHYSNWSHCIWFRCAMTPCPSTVWHFTPKGTTAQRGGHIRCRCLETVLAWNVSYGLYLFVEGQLHPRFNPTAPTLSQCHDFKLLWPSLLHWGWGRREMPQGSFLARS